MQDDVAAKLGCDVVHLRAMNRRDLRMCAGLLVALSFLAAGISMGARADLLIQKEEAASARDLIYLPAPQQAKIMSLGFEQMVADWYWVKGLQYYTDPYQAYNRYKSLGRYLETTLGVDPDFEYAYKFAGLTIPYDTGRLKYANTDQALALLRKGVGRFPRNWEIQFLFAYSLLNYAGKPAEAAEHFALAAELPGSPSYLKEFAGRVFSVGGDLDRAVVFTKTMLASSQDPVERVRLISRLHDLDVEAELRRIENAAKRYLAVKGTWPASGAQATSALGLPPPREGFWLDALGEAHSQSGGERMNIHGNSYQGFIETVQ